MKIVIEIDEDVYTRLFDNGIQDNEIAVDDICEMARALRLGRPLEVQPCEDCISRKAVINYICEGKECYKEDCKGKLYKRCIDLQWVYNIPSVTPQTRWIPVSERLPKAFRFVNCTCHSLIDDREDWVIETVYAPQPSDSPYSDWGNTPMLNSGDCEVVAWMYRDIPQPYKAESEEEIWQ